MRNEKVGEKHTGSNVSLTQEEFSSHHVSLYGDGSCLFQLHCASLPTFPMSLLVRERDIGSSMKLMLTCNHDFNCRADSILSPTALSENPRKHTILGGVGKSGKETD